MAGTGGALRGTPGLGPRAVHPASGAATAHLTAVQLPTCALLSSRPPPEQKSPLTRPVQHLLRRSRHLPTVHLQHQVGLCM